MRELNIDLNHLYSLEQAILGSVLIDNSEELKNEVLKHNLVPEDFRQTHHRYLYKAMLDCWADNKRVDLITMMEYRPTIYRDNNTSGDWNYLNIEIMQTVVSSAHIEQHILKFKEFVIAIFWNNMADSILDINWSYRDVFEVSNNILDRYHNMFNRMTKGLKRDTNDFESEITTKYYNFTNGIASGVTTGSPELDELFKGGFHNGELNIIAGRPGSLKTTLALIMGWESHKKGNAVAFISLEMPVNQLKNKIISKELNIDYHKIKNGNISMDELQMITSFSKQIDDSSFKIIGNIKHIDEIIRTVTELKKENAVDLIFVDYIQRISFSQKTLREGITYITRELKSIAKDNYIPVVALSQLSRAVEARDNKRPVMSDLKESSSIEEDADVILFPYRDAYYRLQRKEDVAPSDMWKVEINIGKGRDIGTGSKLLEVNPINLTIEPYSFSTF